MASSALYFLPERKEYLKLQTGTGDNDDRPYVIANVFKFRELDIDGDLESECVDGAMLVGHCSVTALHTISEAMKIIFGKEEKFILLEARND